MRSHRGDATLPGSSCLSVGAQAVQTEGRRLDLIPYEILLLLDHELADERQAEIVTRTRELIERGGGEFEAHDVWGRRKLAYEIDRKGEGAYHLLTFKAEPATLDEISRVLKITEGVLRHLAVRRSERSPGRTVAPPPENRQDLPEPVPVPSEGE